MRNKWLSLIHHTEWFSHPDPICNWGVHYPSSWSLHWSHRCRLAKVDIKYVTAWRLCIGPMLGWPWPYVCYHGHPQQAVCAPGQHVPAVPHPHRYTFNLSSKFSSLLTVCAFQLPFPRWEHTSIVVECAGSLITKCESSHGIFLRLQRSLLINMNTWLTEYCNRLLISTAIRQIHWGWAAIHHWNICQTKLPRNGSLFDLIPKFSFVHKCLLIIVGNNFLFPSTT